MAALPPASSKGWSAQELAIAEGGGRGGREKQLSDCGFRKKKSTYKGRTVQMEKFPFFDKEKNLKVSI